MADNKGPGTGRQVGMALVFAVVLAGGWFVVSGRWNAMRTGTNQELGGLHKAYRVLPERGPVPTVWPPSGPAAPVGVTHDGLNPSVSRPGGR